MSTTINFADGTALAVISAQTIQVNIQGAYRPAMEVQIAKDAITFDALDKLTADTAKTGKLTLVDGDVQYVRENYSIRAELAVKPCMVTAATSTAAEVDEDRLCVTLAQLTYAEVQTAQMAEQVKILGAQVAALSLGGAS